MNFWFLGLALICSLAITWLAMPSLIRYFIAKKEGQQIREEGPTWHAKKSGTPTMGGLMFLSAATISVLLTGWVAGQLTAMMWAMLLVWIIYSLIGMWDDSIKIFRQQNEGFKPWQKFLCQVIAAVIFVGFFRSDDPSVGWLYMAFIVFWLVGFSNSVNLTDGLDGLVTGLATISFAAYLILALFQHQYDVAIFCTAIIGGLIGFFPFNHKPAKIFMGDMGSLALGGELSAVAIMVHHPWSLLLIGLIYVLETASVILQVFWFRRTGKRIFKMTPIHHAFEMDGWSEWKIDYVFWLVQLVAAAISVVVLMAI